MNRESYTNERVKSVHLYVLITMTVSVIGCCLVAVLLDWELWMPPLLITGVVCSWVVNIRGMFTERGRLMVFALVIWLSVLYHGVHPTSFFDIAPVAVIEMALFSQTEEKRILNISLGLYVFCFLWQILPAITGHRTDIVFDTLTLTRIELHLFTVGFTYWLSTAILKKRLVDLENDAREIRELKETQERTERFLANVSNRLRLPVKSVMQTGSAMMQNAKNEKQEERASQVFRAGKRLSAQIDNMLDYVEISTGDLNVTEEPYRISTLVNEAIGDLELYERDDLPEILLDVEADTPARLLGSKQQLRRVLGLLIENAIKFTQKGGIYVHIYPDRQEDSLNLCIDVTDTGIGMRKRDLERIRTSAYQADADRTRRAGGLGLGFPIVNGFVRAMGGFTSITSAPGEGTQVHVCVPQKAEDEARCMRMPHPERIRAAFFQDPAKFPVPVVRDFYAQMIFHVIRDFRLTLQRVATLADLKKLLAEDDYTHLFIADEEYGRDPAYFETLAETMHVIVVSRKGSGIAENAKVTVLWKPLYSFPLVMVLNAETAAEAQRKLNAVDNTMFSRGGAESSK